jgi:hypothetical protein
VELLVDQLQTHQQSVVFLPVEDVVGHVEGLLLAEPQQQRADDEVHA